MRTVNLQKGSVLEMQNGQTKLCYLIQEGNVIQNFRLAQIPLAKNAVAGFWDNDSTVCRFEAADDVTAAVFEYGRVEELLTQLETEKQLYSLFLRAAIRQRQQVFSLYADLEKKADQFYNVLQSLYLEYKKLCQTCGIEERAFLGIEYCRPLEVRHRAKKWELQSSSSLVKQYCAEYLNLMEQDAALSIGAMMECAGQTRRALTGMEEIIAYLLYQKDFLFAESENDIFSLYFDLAVRAEFAGKDLADIHQRIRLIGDYARKTKFYDAQMVDGRIRVYECYGFAPDGKALSGKNEEQHEEAADDSLQDFAGYLLSYAGYRKEEAAQILPVIEAFRGLPDKGSSDENAYRLRKQVTKLFYEIYKRVFFAAADGKGEPPVRVRMFLSFGFLDVETAGEENARGLLELAGHMELFQTGNVYTVYDWLLAVYRGEKEPSKNDFDLDYGQYVAELRKAGTIKKEEAVVWLADRRKKVEYEMDNMFQSANRITFGRVTTFCPVLCQENLISSLEYMMVTADKLNRELDKLRKIDYSIFFRSRMFSDPERHITGEPVRREVLPDIILMPNAGTKAMMWQEAAGAKRDTPARFLFPIFTAINLEDAMIETFARFRWEICRKEQGARWNDIKDKSLTSEYCDYLQFYKKNNSLSPEVKEKIKNALARSRNNYREVFAADYFSWMKYESKGSVRLNRTARGILARYCPFAKEIRVELSKNPMFQDLFAKMELANAKMQQRVTSLFERYRKEGGEITPELQENLDFYER